ncbi:TonB family protein [Mucilaginibacter glaciei]|uniref:TonB family protein n=1 Tax=Mucilaginibacter glaciei TaxID=2772109 RepID=A0A926NQ80_9SPHI|nr:TonB family protein [Mucilaginibacter glaciei]MBD1393946.1 TonB family protein [Mucilaginibacter glaciei]
MSNKLPNISQIRKYLNGELDADAMHRLEREAQDDPFLMDALEGFEHAGKNEVAGLKELQTRLQKRASKKEQRIVPMWYWGVAASVLIIAGVAGLFYKYSAPQQNTLVAQADKTATAPTELAPAIKSDLAKDSILKKPAPNAVVFDARKPKPSAIAKNRIIDPDRIVENMTEPPVGKPSAETIAAVIPKDSNDLSDMVMNGLALQKKKETQLAETTVAIDTSRRYQLALNSRVKGVQTSPNYNAPKQPVIIAGQVIAKDDGLPIPGVNIRVLGTTEGTLTDVNGKFALAGAKDKTVSVSSLGYESAQVNLNGKDSLNIALRPNNSSLAEVAVVPSGNVQKVNQGAHPARGWQDFKNYLKANAIPLDGITGTVKLQFTIEPNGQLTNLKVTKSLGPATDANALRLVTNGPAWYGNTNSKPEVVKVKVEYKK